MFSRELQLANQSFCCFETKILHNLTFTFTIYVSVLINQITKREAACFFVAKMVNELKS